MNQASLIPLPQLVVILEAQMVYQFAWKNIYHVIKIIDAYRVFKEDEFVLVG